MNGISATTGRPLSGIDHLRQSIRDILTTPIGSRVMRRLYQRIDTAPGVGEHDLDEMLP